MFHKFTPQSSAFNLHFDFSIIYPTNPKFLKSYFFKAR